MTGVEKFALCKALFESDLSHLGADHARQWRTCVQCVANTICRDNGEYNTFIGLCAKDQWLAQDNPFKDDEEGG